MSGKAKKVEKKKETTCSGSNSDSGNDRTAGSGIVRLWA